MSVPHPALSSLDAAQLRRRLALRVDGRVDAVVGLTIEGSSPGSAVGDLVQIRSGNGERSVAAEVIGLRGSRAVLVPLGDVHGIATGDRITHLGVAATVACTNAMLGRVLDARALPIDDAGPLPGPIEHRLVYGDAPTPFERRPIEEPLPVGVRVIDGLITLGRGGRMGIFAGAGVGKSRLLGMLAQGAEADVIVLALIGERGREVGDFLGSTLDAATRQRCVVVVATSDQSPLLRRRGAFVATTIAEHFCAQGKRVLLLMDSLTRFAMAQRELGLAAGEPPTTKGYTPSVFATLPRLLERAGRFHAGSITALYTVLVEGDDDDDPIADAARSILDGHLKLSRQLAERGHYPAVDALRSISRVADSVLVPGQVEVASRFRRLLADLNEAEELLAIGAYVPGVNPGMDYSLRAKAAVLEFTRQASVHTVALAQTLKQMSMLTEGPS